MSAPSPGIAPALAGEAHEIIFIDDGRLTGTDKALAR